MWPLGRAGPLGLVRRLRNCSTQVVISLVCRAPGCVDEDYVAPLCLCHWAAPPDFARGGRVAGRRTTTRTTTTTHQGPPPSDPPSRFLQPCRRWRWPFSAVQDTRKLGCRVTSAGDARFAPALPGHCSSLCKPIWSYFYVDWRGSLVNGIPPSRQYM